MDPRLAVLWDNHCVTARLNSFARALDTHDWPAYEACFADHFIVDYSEATGLAPAETDPRTWAAFVEQCVGPLSTLHRFSNFAIELDGDRARARFYHVSRHRRPNLQGSDQHTQYGTYDASLERVGADDWKIVSLRHSTAWCDGNPGVVDSSTPTWREAADRVFAQSET